MEEKCNWTFIKLFGRNLFAEAKMVVGGYYPNLKEPTTYKVFQCVDCLKYRFEKVDNKTLDNALKELKQQITNLN